VTSRANRGVNRGGHKGYALAARKGHDYASPLGAAVEETTPARPTFHGKELPSRHNKGGINLRAVAEVLSELGMDPAVELVKIVQAGSLPPDVHARILNELLQYTQPKLKSIEVRAKVAATSFDVNDDQARRIAEEFLKASMAA
jgi:hypothetical protein